ncbi:hypothetical protein CL644_01680 [bacterium]|nr:hypothetical protein [bacterium]|tara:strand:+ start:11204 stop:11755 length:552 start_codon:yes stop_codon:yes gene_type:complete
MTDEITDVYFIRHAETFAARKNMIPKKNTGITLGGFAQSLNAAREIKTLCGEVLLSSSLRRAKQTAWTMNTILRVSREEVSFLNERTVTLKKGEIEWETLTSLNERLLLVSSMVQNREEKVILVVTHATFIKALLMMYTYGEMWKDSFESFNSQWKLSPLDYLHVQFFNDVATVLRKPEFTQK